MNDPARLLALFLNGALGRSGRKAAGRTAAYVSGNRGLITASGLLAAAGVAWGIYDSLKSSESGASGVPGVSGMTGGSVMPPIPRAGATPWPADLARAAAARPLIGSVATPPVSGEVPSDMPVEVRRIVRLSVSAARADGTMSSQERDLILRHARAAGVEDEATHELAHPHPLADIVSGVEDEAARRDLYRLAFSIIRADETVTGAERIYLAQLAHVLRLDAGSAAALEAEAAERIDHATGSTNE